MNRYLMKFTLLKKEGENFQNYLLLFDSRDLIFYFFFATMQNGVFTCQKTSSKINKTKLGATDLNDFVFISDFDAEFILNDKNNFSDFMKKKTVGEVFESFNISEFLI
jgi:hypothetical protein